ncbi:DNA primase [Alicyclobacillus curvatus]|nr:DNA primase [Alicyclobacillus curvatus]
MKFFVEYFSIVAEHSICYLYFIPCPKQQFEPNQEGDGMGQIPDEFVETLRQRIDIIDVVGEYVQLRRSGRSYVGLCPFHNERSPSFSVSPDRQMYYCFGCGAGGTVIRFVMDIEGMTFAETVVRLAERANIQVPESLEEQMPSATQTDRHTRMKEAHELAAKYYSYILMNSSAGVQALTYLENRGISKTTMAEFRLGFAPNSERRLVEFLMKRGFEPELLVDCGLVVALGARIVDRFRGRVMIPICDGRGQVVAFGGRALQKEAKPKYLNSPETPLFHKSSVLFNLHMAKRSIRQTQTAVIFEGYMDVISAWQAGLKSGVASMGTALTEDHVRALKRYSDRLTIAYDGDEAGQRATVKVLNLAREERLECRVVQFPDGMDPDDFARQYGAATFVRQFQVKTLTEVQFLIDAARKKANLESPAGRTEYMRQVLSLLGERASPIERSEEVQRLAQEFHVSPEALEQELRAIAKTSRRRDVNKSERESTALSTPVLTAEVRAGNHILQSLLLYPQTLDWLLQHEVMALPLPEQTALLARLYAFRTEHREGTPVSFVESLEDPNLRRLAASLAVGEESEFDEALLMDCLRSLRLQELESRYRNKLQELVEVTLAGDAERVMMYRQEVENLQHEITRYRTPQA